MKKSAWDKAPLGQKIYLVLRWGEVQVGTVVTIVQLVVLVALYLSIPSSQLFNLALEVAIPLVIATLAIGWVYRMLQLETDTTYGNQYLIDHTAEEVVRRLKEEKLV